MFAVFWEPSPRSPSVLLSLPLPPSLSPALFLSLTVCMWIVAVRLEAGGCLPVHPHTTPTTLIRPTTVKHTRTHTHTHVTRIIQRFAHRSKNGNTHRAQTESSQKFASVWRRHIRIHDYCICVGGCPKRKSLHTKRKAEIKDVAFLKAEGFVSCVYCIDFYIFLCDKYI